MSLDALKNRLPDHAKDIKLNLSSLARETVLDDQKKYGVFLASAYAVGERETLNDIVSEVESPVTVGEASAVLQALTRSHLATLLSRCLLSGAERCQSQHQR